MVDVLNIDHPWSPHEAQRKVLQDPHRFKTIVCGRRFGKTEMAINHLLKCAYLIPGEYRYIAPTYKASKRIAWRKLKHFYPAIWRDRNNKWKNEQDLFVDVISKEDIVSRIQLLGADDPDSLRGEGWHGCVLDEYADVDPYLWNAVIRPALTDYRGWAWFIGTPKGENHFYENFIKDKDKQDPRYRSIDGEPITPDSDYKSFQFQSLENPYLDIEEIKKAQEELSADYFRQEYLASFENYTGLVYKEFMQYKDELIIDPIPLKPWWHYYLGIDTGRTTAAVIKAVDDEGNEYIVWELYDIDGLVKDQVVKINNALKGKNVIGKLIDSASQVKREFQNQKLYLQDSQKDILSSIQMTRRKQRDKKWFVFNTCPSFIRELKSRRWDEKKRGTPVPIKEMDHCCNCEDYIQATFLRTPKEPKTTFQKYRDKEMAEIFKPGYVKRQNDWRLV